MNFQNILKVVLISGRSDLHSFCQKLFVNQFALSVEFNPSPALFSNPCLFIFDVSCIKNVPVALQAALLENQDKIIFIITSDVKSELRDYAELTFRNIVHFPCYENLFYCFSHRIIDRLSEIPMEKLCMKARNPLSDSLLGYFSGDSGAIRQVRAKIEAAARQETPVLLLGETGTGKSTAANVIHKMSMRRKNPFCALNVSTVVDSLAASTLFGTAEGAYTDAVKNEGFFKTADGGSLFLDEIGMASPSLQAMLLTVMESGMINKVGSEKSFHVDVRMIFATNAFIKRMLQEGSFRQDLYFRIAYNVIELPALRDRKDDLLLMSQEFAKKHGKNLTYDAMKAIEEYYWPGNIRELHQCLSRAFDLCRETEVPSEYLEFTF